jgi:hypothetical protein
MIVALRRLGRLRYYCLVGRDTHRIAVVEVEVAAPSHRSDLAEADGNDDGNNGDQSRPQARSGNHPRW